jgi:hypothetical protein
MGEQEDKVLEELRVAQAAVGVDGKSMTSEQLKALEVIARGWSFLIEAIDRRTLEAERRNDIEDRRLAFDREREAIRRKEWVDHELNYEKRTMEIQAIAMRMGDLIEKAYHTV